MTGDVIVREAMKTNLALVQPSTSVLDAAKLMKKRRIGCVLVTEDDQPVGILTERDILRKVVAEGKDAGSVTVEKVMTTPIIVIDPYVPLDVAMKTMGKCNIRRLPVVEKGKLLGIITQKDISRISPILHEISREWSDITSRDEAHIKQQIFSGKCEDCGVLSTTLKSVEGRLLCEECIDALKFE